MDVRFSLALMRDMSICKLVFSILPSAHEGAGALSIYESTRPNKSYTRETYENRGFIFFSRMMWQRR